MNFKTIIKNDLWKVNYIVPFVKKHQFDEKGKIDLLRHVAKTYLQLKAVKSKGRRSVGSDTKVLLESVKISIDENRRFIYFLDTGKTIAVPGNIVSNFSLDYDKVIHGTFAALAEKAQGDDEYGEEAMAVAQGIETMCKRIIDAVRSSNSKFKEIQIEYFQNLLTRPATHFDEALQRILFFNQILWQTRHRLNGLGRLDHILEDIYESDKEAGRVNYDSASNLVYDFLQALSLYSGYKSDALEGDIGQIIVLGGKNPDGSYFSNELTKIFLREQAKLNKPDPKTLLRVAGNMPDDLLRLAVSCLTAKTGSPLFSNDERVIPALLQFGLTEEDAYSYCVSACWEPYIVGKSFDQNNVMVFDYFRALNNVLNSGREFDTFEDLKNAYIEENKRSFNTFLRELDVLKWANDPLVSMFTDYCSEKRTDITGGAAKYNNYGVTTVALSNVIDSLFNIREIVYKSKKLTLQALNRARNSDYKNTPEMYKIIVNERKYFGHPENDVEELVNRITSSVASIAEQYRNEMGGTVKIGLSSPGYNILSKKMPADISGRKRGSPYNTHISCIDAAYTEIVGFSGRLEYNRQRFNGNVVDFFMTESLVQENQDKFLLFMKGAIYSGFFQMQMNLLDSKTLIDAKSNPERHKGLIVRVWGFSAYFNDLPESYKNLLIERALAAEQTE